jgi:hypothetical protein
MASKFSMPAIRHYVKGLLSTYELSTKVLGIIHKGVACWQLVDEHEVDSYKLQIWGNVYQPNLW